MGSEWGLHCWGSVVSEIDKFREQEILTEKSGIVKGVKVADEELTIVGGGKQRTMRFVCTVSAHPVTSSTKGHKPLFFTRRSIW